MLSPVEADWPDADAVDRYVRHRPGPGWMGSVDTASHAEKEDREPAFMRFPTWMWRNVEIHDFVEWLRAQNKGKDSHKATGFYGLDLYSPGASMEAVIEYLDHVDRNMAQVARQRYSELLAWSEDHIYTAWSLYQWGLRDARRMSLPP